MARDEQPVEPEPKPDEQPKPDEPEPDVPAKAGGHIPVYRGRGNHSVKELEQLVEQSTEDIIELKANRYEPRELRRGLERVHAWAQTVEIDVKSKKELKEIILDAIGKAKL